MNKIINIGSRESKLAVVQSELAIQYLKGKHPNDTINLVTMKTTGDRILNQSLDKIGGKGLFVKELEIALREKRCDYAVHSLKDMPMEMPTDLPIICFSNREDPRDVLVLPQGKRELDFSKPIGTSSARRMIQLKKIYPEASFEGIRGNVQTRLRKLDEGEYSGIILAAAGLKRLGLEERISRYFTIDEVMPAAGQGILAVQGRQSEVTDIWEGFTSKEATAIALAERAFVRELDGGCSSPIAAYADIEEQILTIRGLNIEAGSDNYSICKLCGSMENADELGKELAQKMKNQ